MDPDRANLHRPDCAFPVNLQANWPIRQKAAKWVATLSEATIGRGEDSPRKRWPNHAASDPGGRGLSLQGGLPHKASSWMPLGDRSPVAVR
jgi:hypothetical protein